MSEPLRSEVCIAITPFAPRLVFLKSTEFDLFPKPFSLTVKIDASSSGIIKEITDCLSSSLIPLTP